MPEKSSRPDLSTKVLQTTDLEHPVAFKRPTRTLRSDILFTFALGIGLAVAYQLREELALLYVSALFAVVLTPVIRGVQRIKIGKWSPGRGSAIAIILLGVGGAITLFVMFALPPVIHDAREFVKELPTRGPDMLNRLKHLPFASHLNVSALNAKLQDYASNFVTYLVASVSTWASGIVKIIAGIVLTIYFLLEGEHAYNWVLSFIAPVRRERLNQTLLRADVRMGRWLLGQGTLMLILGVYSTVVFTLLHVRYSYALGVIMGVFNIIPVMGALVSMALVVLAAAMDSWMRVVYVLIAYAIYVQVENSYLTPKIMQSTVDLPGLAIIVSLLLGSAIDGVMGAMVSVPTAVLVAVLLDEYAIQKDQP
ncbi:MAG TPA: AI-2E family transporter [Acidobacteriaceae bacterium]|jgi:predicted PurR-regulated permease PerM